MGNGGSRRRQRVCNFEPPDLCNLRPPLTASQVRTPGYEGDSLRPPALAMPANKKKDPRYAEIYRDMPGYSGMRPRRLRPMIVGVPPRVGAAYAGIGRRNCGIKTVDPSNGLQTSVSGGFGVVEIGGISGACPRWVTDPAAEPAPPDHKRGVMKRPLRALRRAGSRCRRYGR